ncbi:glycosyltransferase family 4 protein [Cohnella sp. AR92]|uniref:glycosyltransferase family 4 protein n=1 Tax=Cohnella sp. AR92 TaxID=648716 RepID=UPI0013154694|nr:glycosyltransferase family 4 protein [Cohnella sp. AR92]
MKVAFYNHTSTVSGGEINLLSIASNLQGIHPIIFAPEGDLIDRARKAKIPTVTLDSCEARLSRNPIRLVKDSFGMAAAGFRFARAIRNKGIDVIHANSLRAGMMAATFSWWHRTPTVWHSQDIPPGGWIGRGMRLLARLSARSILCISRSVMEGFETPSLQQKLELIHNGVEPKSFSPEERRRIRSALRAKWETPDTAKLVVIVGQITPWKRQADAILALEKLVRRGQNAYLWIIGEAKFREENRVYLASLHDLVRKANLMERVRFTGFRDDVMEHCCAADVLWLCSENEPFGRVIIEAMSQSVPVVATNGGGVPEIIEPERSGLLYATGDITALADQTERLLSDDCFRQRIGEAASDRVALQFTIRSAVQKIESVYRKILADSKQGTQRPKEGQTYEQSL